MGMESKEHLIKIEDIGKYFDMIKGFTAMGFYGPRILKAVDHISFQIEKGQDTRPGRGEWMRKSTVARLIARLIEHTFGKVYFKGIDLFALKGKEMRT